MSNEIDSFNEVEIIPQPTFKLGDWYWVDEKEEDTKYEDQDGVWLGCISHVGSNYVRLRSAGIGNGYTYTRVHFNDSDDVLKFEPNSSQYIKDQIKDHEVRIEHALQEITLLASNLGIVPDLVKLENSISGNDSANALMVISNTNNLDLYKHQLLEAKGTKLPKLFQSIKDISQNLTNWLKADSLPLLIQSDQMRKKLTSIDDRIFNISLYAGLIEDVVTCSKGKPAGKTDKLHIMQRRLYMDEECLLNYKHGGMEFNDIREYDAWISKPENRDRMLPHPKSLVCMRVRRNEKQRDWGGDFIKLFTDAEKGRADKYTFMYLRNGENVYRLTTDIEFDAKIFPDLQTFDPSEPMMARKHHSKIVGMITVREYEVLLENYDKQVIQLKKATKLNDAWEKQNPNVHRSTNPDFQWVPRPSDPTYEYEKIDQDNIYYDDTMEFVSAELKKYNRISLIVQGLFDRTTIFNPHEKVISWTAEGFDKAIKLVYDGSNVLNFREPPSYEQYVVSCNESMNKDSVLIGQEVFWEEKEADKECRRLENDWRTSSSEYRPERFRPYGNSGPGYMVRPTSWRPRARTATFTWMRDRLRPNDYRDTSEIKTTVTVPASALFNASAYQLGDFLQFFKDPRTRADYLKWAPTLLAAEELHAGTYKKQDDHKINITYI